MAKPFLTYQQQLQKLTKDKKLIINDVIFAEQKLNVMGKKDLFSVVIAFRYLLSKEDFHVFKNELVKIIGKYLKQSQRISEKTVIRYNGISIKLENDNSI